ncbi:CapA family protein [Haloechinothrix salitolerans]|uniref:CapA family protein n=1 Tax=Haloechinothrix salitolerans TaxID=926830 RepID=A0ABW2BTH5_9PSEU
MRGRRLSAILLAIMVAVTVACSPRATRGVPTAPTAPTSRTAMLQEQDRPRSFSVVATGDILIHPPLTAQADRDEGEVGDGRRDFRDLFAGIRPVIQRADVALCHLEVPLAAPGGPFSGYPAFNAPPELADALVDTGYDACSTASNHTLDQGEEGVKRTLDAMDAAGLRHTGSARSAREAAKPLLMDVGGVTVGHVSYSYGFNGIPLPAGKSWLANQLSAEQVIAEAKRARSAGADVVIASLHWGEEYRHEPSAEQTTLARRLLGTTAIDLIVGHHAHVVQPMEHIKGKWVAYGLGNSVARHEEPRGVSEEGIAARFRFTRGAQGWRVDKAEYVPTLVDLGPPIRLRDLTAPSAEPAPKSLRRIDRIVRSRNGGQHELSRPRR